MLTTDLEIKRLTSKDKPFLVRVNNGKFKGLYLKVMPSGARFFVHRYMKNGQTREMRLATYDGRNLAYALEEHRKSVALLNTDIDPAEKRAEEKENVDPTFKDLLDEFWKEELKNSPTAKERLRLIEKDALPSWKKKKLSSITRRQAVLLLDKVKKRGAPVTANRLLGVLVRMFNFAAERGLIEQSPISGMRRTSEKARKRVLNDDEIKALWGGLDLNNPSVDMYRVTKLALKIILLTGQRPGEVAGMRWDEIQDGFWNIPASRMKNSEPQRVPICPMAADVIEQARPYSDSNYVFQSSYKDKSPITRPCLTRAVTRHAAEIGIAEPFTPHDLRRTLRTRLAGLGVTDIVAEKVLGHKLQGIMAVYNQHSYDTEKRQALMRWEIRLKEIVGLTEPRASNVVAVNFGSK